MITFSNFFTDSIVKLADFSRNFDLANLGFSKNNLDVLVIFFVLVAAFLFAVNLGRSKVLLIIVSTYLASVIYELFPYGRFFSKLRGNYVFDALGFIFLIFILYFLLSHSALRAAMHYSSRASWFQIFIFSLLGLSLILSNIAKIVPKDTLTKLSPLLVNYFSTKEAQFWWALLPLIFIALIRKREKPMLK